MLRVNESSKYRQSPMYRAFSKYKWPPPSGSKEQQLFLLLLPVTRLPWLSKAMPTAPRRETRREDGNKSKATWSLLPRGSAMVVFSSFPQASIPSSEVPARGQIQRPLPLMWLTVRLRLKPQGPAPRQGLFGESCQMLLMIYALLHSTQDLRIERSGVMGAQGEESFKERLVSSIKCQPVEI